MYLTHRLTITPQCVLVRHVTRYLNKPNNTRTFGSFLSSAIDWSGICLQTFLTLNMILVGYWLRSIMFVTTSNPATQNQISPLRLRQCLLMVFEFLSMSLTFIVRRVEWVEIFSDHRETLEFWVLHTMRIHRMMLMTYNIIPSAAMSVGAA